MLNHSLIGGLAHICTLPPNECSCTHSLTRSLTGSLAPWLTHILIHSLSCLFEHLGCIHTRRRLTLMKLFRCRNDFLKQNSVIAKLFLYQHSWMDACCQITHEVVTQLIGNLIVFVCHNLLFLVSNKQQRRKITTRLQILPANKANCATCAASPTGFTPREV